MDAFLSANTNTQSGDCAGWANEGEMLEWAKQIQTQKKKIEELEEEKKELLGKIERRDGKVDEMRIIIQNLAAALHSFIIEEI
tara:strand:- start:652 stop:900 length:249 start_codon:yes stop_codon:yes gene_type:complete